MMKINLLITSVFATVLFFLTACSTFSSKTLISKNTMTNQIAGSTLVLLAHPDDETWMSGTIAKLAHQGEKITVVYATSGDRGHDATGQNRSGKVLAETREKEARAALLALGVQTTPIFLAFADTTLGTSQLQIEEKLRRTIWNSPTDPWAYRNIISFSETGITQHTDHIAIGEIAINLAKQIRQAGHPVTLYQAIVSQRRAAQAETIAQTYNHPYRIKGPSLDHQVTHIEDNTAFASHRLNAFRQHTSQFPPSMHSLWEAFVHQAPEEEFHLVNWPSESVSIDNE